jgi:hypothetical protein
MNKTLQNLAMEAGLYCDGVPDSWDEAAIETYTRLLVLHLSHICREVAMRADEAANNNDQSDYGLPFAQGQAIGALACAGALMHWVEDDV